MEFLLKCFVLIDKYGLGQRTLQVVFTTCKDDALLHFIEKRPNIMDYDCIYLDILRYAWENLKDAPEISIDVSNDKCRSFRYFISKLTEEDQIILANWVLKEWGVDPSSLEVDDSIKYEYNLFYEQFKNFPREKQLEIGKRRFRSTHYSIDCLPMDMVGGIEKITQPLEDKIKKMRLEALKAARPDVPVEIVDMCIGEHL